MPVVIYGGTQGMTSRATGINNRGQIVGVDGDGGRGFIAAPSAQNPLRSAR